MNLAFSTALLTALAAHGAQALTLSEPPDFPSSPSAYMLDPGVNMFSGAAMSRCDFGFSGFCGGPQDTDAFILNVPQYHRIISASLTISNLSVTLPTDVGGGNAFGSGFLTEVFSADGVYDLFNGYVTSPTTFQITALTTGLDIGSSNMFDWEFQVEVNEVPVPAGLPLLVSGFGALAVARQRKI